MESSIIVTVITSIISDGTNINSSSANKKSIDDNNSTIMITIFIVGNLRTKIDNSNHNNLSEEINI